MCATNGGATARSLDNQGYFALSIFYSKQRGPLDCVRLRDIRVVGKRCAQLTPSGDIVRLVLISTTGGATVFLNEIYS